MIKINIISINQKILNLYCSIIEKNTKQNNIQILKINIPNQRKRFALLKSPHVNKKAQEHFQLNIYKKTFYLKTTLDKLKRIIVNKPKQLKITMRKII